MYRVAQNLGIKIEGVSQIFIIKETCGNLSEGNSLRRKEHIDKGCRLASKRSISNYDQGTKNKFNMFA